MDKYNYSIIIPHFNIPGLLRRLLSSIPQRDDVQVIVVDDCSPRQSLSELEKLKAEYADVEWCATPKNSGGGAARNIGLQRAQGRYLIFADADDFFTPAFNRALDDYVDSDYDIIYFSANSVDTDTYENAERAEYFPRIIGAYLNSGNEDDLRYSFIVPWGRFIRRAVVADHNVQFEEVRVADDYWFSTLSDFYAKKITADRRAIYTVTDRRDSVSKSIAAEKKLSELNTMLRRYDFMKEHAICRHTHLQQFMMPLLELRENYPEVTIREAELLLAHHGIDIKEVDRFIRKWKLRQLMHKMLLSVGLQRIRQKKKK